MTNLKNISNGSNSYPLNVSKVGHFKVSILGGKMLEVKTKSIAIKSDSAEKKTIISVLLNDASLINCISFKITEPKYYS